MSAVLSDADLELLSAACALDLMMFRRSHVQARVDRACEGYAADDVQALHERIIGDDAARAAFRRSVAISVTGFFRDPEQFDALRQVLTDAPLPARPVRAWSAGCATGEEAWSLAATLVLARWAAGATVLGSDLLAENVRIARALRPHADDLGGVRLPPSLAIRFECRDLVRQGVPGTGWDIALCRNVAIYLREERRRGLHRALARGIKVGGFLMLGRSERLGDPSALGLERVVPHIYRRVA